MWGVGFGLPELYHPDEPAYVLQALAVARGLPNGLTFANPPFFKYVLLAEYAAAYGLERLLGVAHSPELFVEQFRADPSQLYLIARVSSAVFGGLTAIAAGALATAVGRSQRVGLIAAAITAIAYLLVRDSHFGVNDALVTSLVTLGLVYCIRVQRGGSRRDYLVTGAMAGLSFAAKYYGIALLAPLLMAHAWRNGARRQVDLLVGLAACLVAALVAFPSLVLEPTRVAHDIYLHLYLDAVGGYDGLDPSGGFAFYGKALTIGLGWPLVIAAVVGLVLAIRRRDRAALIVGVFGVAFLGLLGAAQLYFARFGLPALPALIVEASLALDALFSLHRAIGLAAALVVAVQPTIDAIRFDTLLAQTDTRTLARDWIATNLPAAASIAADASPLGPPLPNHATVGANQTAVFDLTPADYRARGTDYIVTSSYVMEAHAIDPTREARRLAFQDELREDATAVMQFRPYTGQTGPAFAYDQIYAPFTGLDELERPGPTLTVYRLAR